MYFPFKLEEKLGVTAFDFTFGETDAKEFNNKTQKQQEAITAKKKTFIDKYNAVFGNAFEWRFKFPEVLDEEGQFKGFDVIIGNPPYIYNRDLSELERNYY